MKWVVEIRTFAVTFIHTIVLVLAAIFIYLKTCLISDFPSDNRPSEKSRETL